MQDCPHDLAFGLGFRVWGVGVVPITPKIEATVGFKALLITNNSELNGNIKWTMTWKLTPGFKTRTLL